MIYESTIPQTTLSPDYKLNKKTMDSILQIDKSFDLICKDLLIGGKDASLYFIDGFVKDEVMEKILEMLTGVNREDIKQLKGPDEFAAKFVTYVETDVKNEFPKIVEDILAGTSCLLLDGYDQAILIDARTYPARSIEEPESDKVLRGSHDGFSETIVQNTALIRRRIRDVNLRMEISRIGGKSKTDIVLCYMQNKVNRGILRAVREKLSSLQPDAFTMAQESIAESLFKPKWYNPFPKVRYTERPDTAAANVIEGKIALIVDNSSAVMILPTYLLDFIQDSNDYYFSPVVGTYLRLVRMLVFFATLILIPVWFLLIQNPDFIPSWLDFIKVEEPNKVPVIVQLLLIEFVIDALKLASLNTPSALSNSFSVVGALVIGDFAIKANWFVPEVVLYMAFVAMANFTQPSFELGYALKFFRMFITILTAIFNVWGFCAGLVIMIVVLFGTPTIGNKGYLYPLIPFDAHALKALLIRKPISKKNT